MAIPAMYQGPGFSEIANTFFALKRQSIEDQMVPLQMEALRLQNEKFKTDLQEQNANRLLRQRMQLAQASRAESEAQSAGVDASNRQRVVDSEIQRNEAGTALTKAQTGAIPRQLSLQELSVGNDYKLGSERNNLMGRELGIRQSLGLGGLALQTLQANRADQLAREELALKAQAQKDELTQRAAANFMQFSQGLDNPGTVATEYFNAAGNPAMGKALSGMQNRPREGELKYAPGQEFIGEALKSTDPEERKVGLKLQLLNTLDPQGRRRATEQRMIDPTTGSFSKTSLEQEVDEMLPIYEAMLAKKAQKANQFGSNPDDIEAPPGTQLQQLNKPKSEIVKARTGVDTVDRVLDHWSHTPDMGLRNWNEASKDRSQDIKDRGSKTPRKELRYIKSWLGESFAKYTDDLGEAISKDERSILGDKAVWTAAHKEVFDPGGTVVGNGVYRALLQELYHGVSEEPTGFSGKKTIEAVLKSKAADYLTKRQKAALAKLAVEQGWAASK